MEVLTNNEVKTIKQLKLKKFRSLEECFIIEGEKLIQEAIEKQPNLIQQIIVRSGLAESDWLNGFNVKVAQPKQMEQISSLKTPPNAIAVINFINIENESDFIIALDDVQNPGNLGTIIRTAAWLGCYKIIASEKTVDVYNPKVIQATMGSIFDVSIEYVDLVDYLENIDLPIYGTCMDGHSIYESDPVKKAVFVLGSEGKGMSEAVESKINKRITIPKLGKGESLNVAMATGIILSEFKRKIIA